MSSQVGSHGASRLCSTWATLDGVSFTASGKLGEGRGPNCSRTYPPAPFHPAGGGHLQSLNVGCFLLKQRHIRLVELKGILFLPRPCGFSKTGSALGMAALTWEHVRAF